MFVNDSEIRNNIDILYSVIRDKRRVDPQAPPPLHGLLVYKNTNTIWKSAVILTVRCYLYDHENIIIIIIIITFL